jgi:LPXTG-motif cell wall-anchored protein
VRSRKLRAIGVIGASAALAITAIAPSDAQGAPAGTGRSGGAASLLTLALGDGALDLRLVGEDSATSNVTGAVNALERVTPLQLTSSLLPALNGVSQPTVESSSTSGEHATATPGVDLASLLTGVPVPGLLTGVIDPVAMRSIVDATGATSAADGAVRNVSVLGGLLQLGSATADLGSSALVSDAGATRGLSADRIEVLDLTALLDALGISLADLPLDAAVGLLGGLGLPIPGDLSPQALLTTIDGLLTQTAPVRAQVATLQGQIDGLQTQLAPLTTQLTGLTTQVSQLTALAGSCSPLDPVLALLGLTCGQVAGALATAQGQLASVDATIDGLQAQINGLVAQVDGLLATVQSLIDQLLGLVDGVLDELADAPLLAVDDLVVGLTALADDTLAGSSAKVVGSIGAVEIGGLSLGGIDPAATVAQVTGLADQVTGALGNVLSLVDPSLANLVDIDLLDQSTAVTEEGGVTNAIAGITALRATITPPDVCGLLGRLGVQDTVGSVLGSLGESLPALPGPVGTVLGDLGSTVRCESAAAAGGFTASSLVDGVASALTQPLTIEALSLGGAGSFTVPAAPGAPGTPGAPGQLPNTGGNAQLALVAVGLGVLGLAARRVLARTA